MIVEENPDTGEWVDLGRVLSIDLPEPKPEKSEVLK